MSVFVRQLQCGFPGRDGWDSHDVVDHSKAANGVLYMASYIPKQAVGSERGFQTTNATGKPIGISRYGNNDDTRRIGIR